MPTPKDSRFAFAIFRGGREREREYAKLVLISEKANCEERTNRGREGGREGGTRSTASTRTVSRRSGRHGQLQAQKEGEEERGERGKGGKKCGASHGFLIQIGPQRLTLLSLHSVQNGVCETQITVDNIFGCTEED